MAASGARHIALLARREPTPLEAEQIAAIEALGSRVIRLKADVAALADVETALATLRENSPPLAGVFHLAGALDDGAVKHQTREKLTNVFAPKVSGAWNLHLATLHDPLKWFVLFSSAASMFGSPGQANHAAANAFLDALAWHRRLEQRPALSINWGPWAQIGAAAARGVQRRTDLAGVEMILPEEGWASLHQLLQRQDDSPPQAAVIRMDASALPRRLKQAPLFERLLLQQGAFKATTRRRAEFLDAYGNASYSERRRLVLNHLQHLVAAALGIDDPSSIPHGEALSDLGLDSLTTLELRSSLESSLELRTPSSLVFDFPTLLRLSDYCVDALAAREAPAQAPTLPSAPLQAFAFDGGREGAVANVRGDEQNIPESADHILQMMQRINNLSAELDRP
jgi:acyl carrier protein